MEKKVSEFFEYTDRNKCHKRCKIHSGSGKENDSEKEGKI